MPRPVEPQFDAELLRAKQPIDRLNVIHPAQDAPSKIQNSKFKNA
jgi:hypothetical protein